MRTHVSVVARKVGPAGSKYFICIGNQRGGRQASTKIMPLFHRHPPRAWRPRFRLSYEEFRCMEFLKEQVGPLEYVGGIGFNWGSVAKAIMTELKRASDGRIPLGVEGRIAHQARCLVEDVCHILYLMESPSIRFIKMECREWIDGQAVLVPMEEVTRLMARYGADPSAKQRVDQVEISWVRQGS